MRAGRERNAASDFNAALDDHQQHLRRKKAADEMGRRYAQAKLVPIRPRTHPSPPRSPALALTLVQQADSGTCSAAEVLSAGAISL